MMLVHALKMGVALSAMVGMVAACTHAPVGQKNTNSISWISTPAKTGKLYSTKQQSGRTIASADEQTAYVESFKVVLPQDTSGKQLIPVFHGDTNLMIQVRVKQVDGLVACRIGNDNVGEEKEGVIVFNPGPTDQVECQNTSKELGKDVQTVVEYALAYDPVSWSEINGNKKVKIDQVRAAVARGEYSVDLLAALAEFGLSKGSEGVANIDINRFYASNRLFELAQNDYFEIVEVTGNATLKNSVRVFKSEEIPFDPKGLAKGAVPFKTQADREGLVRPLGFPLQAFCVQVDLDETSMVDLYLGGQKGSNAVYGKVGTVRCGINARIKDFANINGYMSMKYVRYEGKRLLEQLDGLAAGEEKARASVEKQRNTSKQMALKALIEKNTFLARDAIRANVLADEKTREYLAQQQKAREEADRNKAEAEAANRALLTAQQKATVEHLFPSEVGVDVFRAAYTVNFTPIAQKQLVGKGKNQKEILVAAYAFSDGVVQYQNVRGEVLYTSEGSPLDTLPVMKTTDLVDPTMKAEAVKVCAVEADALIAKIKALRLVKAPGKKVGNHPNLDLIKAALSPFVGREKCPSSQDYRSVVLKRSGTYNVCVQRVKDMLVLDSVEAEYKANETTSVNRRAASLKDIPMNNSKAFEGVAEGLIADLSLQDGAKACAKVTNLFPSSEEIKAFGFAAVSEGVVVVPAAVK